MKKLFLQIFLLIFSLSFSQNLDDDFKIIYEYKNHSEFDYLKKIDRLCAKISNSVEKNFINPNFQYIEDSLTSNFKNSIVTNYGTNSKVKFIFEDDNLSYISEFNFDKFRRNFYKDENLFVLLSVNDNYKFKENLKTITYKKYNIGILELENFISATFYDDITDRYLQFRYFLKDDELMKIVIKELTAQYSWDMVNYNEFYFKNNNLIYESFSQTIMDFKFSLDTEYDSKDLYNISNELFEIINK